MRAEKLMIIGTPDALLVTHLHKARYMKKVVPQLEIKEHDSDESVVRLSGGTMASKEKQPIEIKRIKYTPDTKRSLRQIATATSTGSPSTIDKVVNGEREIVACANGYAYVPAGRKRRRDSVRLLDLETREVDGCEYLGKDHTVRFENIDGWTKA